MARWLNSSLRIFFKNLLDSNKLMKKIISSIKAVMSWFVHRFFWLEPQKHISLLRIFVFTCGYALLGTVFVFFAHWGEHDLRKEILEVIAFICAVITVFQISDGVVLTEEDLKTLEQGGVAAQTLIPRLLIDASKKCQIGLVFAIYGWIVDLVAKHLT